MTAELKLYNTLTRTKAVFNPIDAENVRMYVCGPTVYDFAHIGNARPVIVFDVLYRLLRHVYGEDHVTYVRNITDVDDKINARALRDYPELPLNEAIRKVTEKTANQFHEDVKALGCLAPTHEPRATEHIKGMVAIIQKLLDAKHAYVATGGEGREVLFDTSSMPEYGELSKRKLEDQQAGARVAVEAHKKNPGDFVLWKESAANEPGWPGMLIDRGEKVDIFGRPGWHIECSAMAKFHLGEVFDIHGGGLDLIFPHHENEIAQSRCAHGTDVMAKVWMHNGFLQVEGRKMSKSEGNFVTIHELLHTEKFGGRRWPGEVLRLAMLMTHYRQPIDFSLARLAEAERVLARWGRALCSKVDKLVFCTATGNQLALDPLVERLFLDDLNSPWLVSYISTLATNLQDADDNVLSEVVSAMDLLGFDASALSVQWQITEILDVYRDASIQRDGIKSLVRQLIEEENYEEVSELAGDSADAQEIVVEAGLDRIVNHRLDLIRAKNFAGADRIRDDLLAMGIQLKDSKDSVTGERVTTWEVKR